MKYKILSIVTGVILASLLVLQIDKSILFIAGLIILTVSLGVLFAMKKINKYDILGGLTAFVTISIILLFFILPSYAISGSQGTVLSNNWWTALNWMKENTPECAVVATYWDPGHFITGIANRSVVFDGASQNDKFLRSTNESNIGIDVQQYNNGVTQVKDYRNGNVETARIKDIAITLFTDNETLAYNILKEYRNKGCDEVYFIASSDLIFKSQWWTYFSTWDPLKNDPKGTSYNYFPLQLQSRNKLISDDGYGYEYPISSSQSIIIYNRNSSLEAVLKQGSEYVKINKIIYPSSNGYALFEDPTAEMKGTVLIADQNLNLIFFIPKELENSMFTRMFFYNGAGLEHFEFVNDWGGEVKLFRIKIDD